MSDPIIRILVEDQSPPGASQQPSQPTPGGAPPSASGVPGGGPSAPPPAGQRSPQPDETGENASKKKKGKAPSKEEFEEVEGRITTLVVNLLKQSLRYSFPGGVGGVQGVAKAFPRAAEGLASGAEGLAGKLGGQSFGKEIGDALRQVLELERKISENVHQIAEDQESAAEPGTGGVKAAKEQRDAVESQKSDQEKTATPKHFQSNDPFAQQKEKPSIAKHASDVEAAIGKNVSKAAGDAEKGAARAASGAAEAGSGAATEAAAGAAEAGTVAAAEGAAEAGVVAGGAALGPPGLIAAVAVVALAEAAKLTTGALNKLENSFLQTAGKLADVSPQIGMAEAQADVRKLQLDIKQGKELGPALSRIVEADSKTEANMTEALLPITKKFGEFFAGWAEFKEKASGYLLGISQWLTNSGLDKKDEKPDAENELMNSFFSIGAPFAESSSHPADKKAGPPSLSGGRGYGGMF